MLIITLNQRTHHDGAGPLHRGFAAQNERMVKNPYSASVRDFDASVELSDEQAEELLKWLAAELYGVRILVEKVGGVRHGAAPVQRRESRSERHPETAGGPRGDDRTG